MNPGRRDECTQTPEKLERFEEKLAGAVGERPLHPVA
jgi:hypothetical protein